MPRDGSLVWCDYCGIFLAPLGKKAKAGERASAVLDDEQMVCVKCAERHGITTQSPKTAGAAKSVPASPRATVPTDPVPVVAEDPAQAALDALPAWIKEDGARHGHNRLKAATAEAERLFAPAAKPAPRPAPPRPESLSYRPPTISPEQEDLAYLEAHPVPPLHEALLSAVETLDRLESRDTKEAPKPARPVRRPARPRRAPSPSALAALAPASDTDEAAVMERIRDESAGAPAPRPWAQEMPGPAAPVRTPQPRPSSRPDRTREQIAAERRELALAYAERHGTLMAPPSRRPIVTAEEIRSGMRPLPEVEGDAPLEYHPDVYLTDQEATHYLGLGPTTLSRWRMKGQGPAFLSDNGKILYRVAELNQFRADRLPALTPGGKHYRKDTKQQQTDRLEELVKHLEQGMGPGAAAEAVGYRDTTAARYAARAAGRQDIYDKLAVAGRQAAAESGRRLAEAKREAAAAKMDRFVELLDQGIAAPKAAQQAGYTRIGNLRASARHANRTDVLALIPNGRTKAEAAEGRAA